jgi:IS605 OrfB family transposase
MPTNLDYKAIREYRILPRNGSFYLELIYKSKDIQVEVDRSKALMIDHGMNNWLTCVSNEETSLIIDGRHLKSIKQGYNKRVALLTKGKANSYWSKRLARLTESRNRTMRDAVNKAAPKAINYCWTNKIATVIFGWNAGMKNGINLASQTHQNWVQIPTGRLKGRIAQLCEHYGIRFIETAESYTSKASFVDLDVLPKFPEKPEGWQPSGQRVKRGLYRALEGLLINCDCNGAANIGRKVAATLGLCLKGVSRGDLITPLKVPLWT